METQTLDDRRAAGTQLILEGEYLVFSCYSIEHDTSLDRDYDTEIAELMALTRRSRSFVQHGIDGYSRLRDLPRLREMHRQRPLLDVPRLAAIDRVLRVLPPGTDPETFAIFDEALVEMFTPGRSRLTLPSLWSITRKLRRLIAEVDASVDFDPKKRRKREKSAAPTASFHPIAEDFHERVGLTLAADATTMAAIGAFLDATAKEHKLSRADAMIQLLTGAITPSPRVIIHVFTPRGGASSYLPGFGWTDAEASAQLDALLESAQSTVVDLDEVFASEVSRYSPTPAMAAYTQARDGTCVFPGCNVPAKRCQLDHRIPFEEGGKTTPDNLYCLCQHHHNVKTDRRAFYVPDPHTGETVWIFPDGTCLISEDKGILRAQATPRQPRWATTPAKNRATRARVARFNAKCHALCDAYEAGGDFYECVRGIRALEIEYGLIFEFHPQPEDLTWIPPEPDPQEPPYPDPA